MLQKLCRRAPALLLCASLLIPVGAACGDSGVDTAPEPTTPTTPTIPTTDGVQTIEVAFAGGEVQGGRRTERVEVGEEVRVRATSDVAEELHVHTYDLRVPLEPSQPAEVVFTADIPGRHEVEFEKSGRQALTLEVA